MGGRPSPVPPVGGDGSRPAIESARPARHRRRRRLEDDSNPWLRTVLALADEQCRRHTASQVVLRRYGSRAWGGIGLAASLVLTLAALFSPPGTTPAVASRDPDLVGETSRANPDHWPEPPAPVPAATARNAVGVPPHESRSIDSSTEDESPRRDEGASRPVSLRIPRRVLPPPPARKERAAAPEGRAGASQHSRRPRRRRPPGAARRGDAGANATAAGGGSDVPDPSSTHGEDPARLRRTRTARRAGRRHGNPQLGRPTPGQPKERSRRARSRFVPGACPGILRPLEAIDGRYVNGRVGRQWATWRWMES